MYDFLMLSRILTDNKLENVILTEFTPMTMQ